jgi:hypothetical protein
MPGSSLLTNGFPSASVREVLLENANYTGVYGTLNLINIGRNLLDGVSKTNELCFTLRRWSTADAVHLVHRDAADLARYLFLVVRVHREFKHHAVGVVTDDTAPVERHAKCPL